jgi:5'-nucleotidase / UDP-sugar diphosphatase
MKETTMNWKLALIALALVGAAVVGWLWLSPDEYNELELTILHTNDIHSHYDSFEPWGEPLQGGAARLAVAIETVREEADNVLLLDAGDQFQGTLYYTVGGAGVVADVMNEIGYDAMVIGNHEFDSGPAELARFIELAEFPIISANTDASADVSLSETILPFAMFFYSNEPVAVIGLTSEHTAIASSPGPNVHFLDMIDTAQQTVQELEAMGVNKIIALTHLGFDRDLELAASVHGIDVIIGGHSHTNLDSYPTVTSSLSDEPVLVATAHEWGKQLGRLNVTFTAEGLVGAFDGMPIAIDESIAEDPAMLDLLANYGDDINALMTTIVGATDVALNGAREDIRVRETNLGNLICDAMLWKTRGFNTTLAIQNGGGIRASIPKGMITMGQVLEALPYGNQITVVGLSGEGVWAALEHGVGGVEDGAGRFPHVGGLRYGFDPTAEQGARVISVEVWDAVSETYAPIDLEARYQLATNNFIANGGDDYVVLALSSERYDSGWLLSDALAEYLDEMSPVDPDVEGRITEAAGDES